MAKDKQQYEIEAYVIYSLPFYSTWKNSQIFGVLIQTMQVFDESPNVVKGIVVDTYKNNKKVLLAKKYKRITSKALSKIVFV